MLCSSVAVRRSGRGASSSTRRDCRMDVRRLTSRAASAYMRRRRPDGRVVMQRTANPRTAVRFRFRPPGLSPFYKMQFRPGRSPRCTVDLARVCNSGVIATRGSFASCGGSVLPEWRHRYAGHERGCSAAPCSPSCDPLIRCTVGRSTPLSTSRLIAVWRMTCGVTVSGSSPTTATASANGLSIRARCSLSACGDGKIQSS